MRTKENLTLRQMGAKYMIVRVDAGQVNLTEVYTLNATAAALWQWIQGREFTPGELADYLCGHYEVESTVARQDIDCLLADWRNFGMIDE